MVPAFFIGLTSLVVLARQTRSTEAAAEAMNAAPGTEGRRTLALALACLVPAAAGLVWVPGEVAVATWRDPARRTGGSAPCRPPGVGDRSWRADPSPASAAACSASWSDAGSDSRGLPRWPSSPWSSSTCSGSTRPRRPATRRCGSGRPGRLFQSGTDTDGTAIQYGGNAVFYLVYLLCLCAAAVIVAVWHDRVARTGRLKALFAATVAVVG